MSKIIEVRIRHEDTKEPVRLTDWPMDDLDGLLATVKSWGLMDGNGVSYDEATFGQLVVTESAAYFEVVFGA